MTRSVFFYVQHLLGIGHLARASLIAQSLAQRGAKVTMALGGIPVDGFPGAGIDVVQLEPVRTDVGFSRLLDRHGTPVDDAFKAGRREQLLQAFNASSADILLVEAFPFGRRQMRFEILPLLEAAHAQTSRPTVACSIRDVLQVRPAERNAETILHLRQYFDILLVHGDPEFIPLAETFPEAEIADLVHYTGIVSAPPGELRDRPADIVVSAGGGIAGGKLMETAKQAIALTSRADASWCMITGANLEPDRVSGLKSDLPENVQVVTHRSDFRALLQQAQLSVSQAGYNTAADILRSGCRSIMVPFAEAGESEQTLRVQALADAGRVLMIPESALTAQTLAKSVDRALLTPAERNADLPRLDGADVTAEMLLT